MTTVPCWYIVLGLVWATYQGVRGIVETRFNNRSNGMVLWQKVLVLDIHDFAFRFICTLAGFVGLFVTYRIGHGADLQQLSVSSAAVLSASFLVGIMGVGGQLHYVILLGNLPSTK